MKAIGQMPRPKSGSTFELLSWFYMRVSGLLMALMITFHLLWMHLIVGLDNINFSVVADRWMYPITGTLWRVFDLLLLIFAVTHGMNGIRFSIEDYVHNRSWQLFLKTAVAILLLFLLFIGSYIVFVFEV
ncbi:MAG: hypothetical protein B6242_10080 [Anaerolineaceae bacterium 4572_78]|nr:MAG: hypothetical protein B6242_10080 [Anaerolineaceae bacterium 4572_78]